VTVKDTYPLPRIQDIFDQLQGAKIFTVLDLKSGYWQTPIAEKDRYKTAFITHRGLYQYKRCPFGLANAPGNFQRLMDYVMSGLVGVCVLLYLDDLICYSTDVENHARDLEQVLARFRQYNLKVKGTKCTFAKTEVELLGFIINEEGIRSNPDKTAAINQLPPPTTVKGVRQFLGMAGYYQLCVEDYAQLASPLTKLLRKNQKFEWGEEQQKGFQGLKDMLVSVKVMAYPDLSKPYKVYCDASDHTIGGVMTQDNDQGLEKVVQYISHQLSSSQQNWSTIEKECYAVVYCLLKLRPYLYGHGHPVRVLTDHQPLRSLFTKQFHNTKIERWSVLLTEYQADIQYIQGKKNLKADMLSRIPPQPILSSPALPMTMWSP
jgi:hypothetical protein